MKKIKKAAAEKSKRAIGESSRKAKNDDTARLHLTKGMKYWIKKVPAHPLHFDSYCNQNFGEHIKEYLGEEVLNLFRETIFGSFLDMPRAKYPNACLC
ncbi:hypothetical protein P3S67_023972 [Capsicum chacoense]